MTIDGLKAALAARPLGPDPTAAVPPAHLPAGGFRHSSVLVPLYERDGQPHVLLTLRPTTMRRHAGQIAFPGGALDPGEDSLEAALREAREEIGLDRRHVSLLGRLSEIIVLTTPFRLTPWVASVPYPYPYVADPEEVEEILHVSFADLLDEAAYGVRRVEAYGMLLDTHTYRAGAHVIWGATARILHELLTVWRTL
ncbi:MAG TPA: CoA pyrophosphatase [Anaeromyxobacteraceae bacterium]|nr:CoA pyrophosphatase [Anaeromyxobacteraceae bacterium]